jgi:hypothetical protein
MSGRVVVIPRRQPSVSSARADNRLQGCAAKITEITRGNGRSNIFPCRPEPLCSLGFSFEAKWTNQNEPSGHHLWPDHCERGYFGMIQRHGIGVIGFDEWVSPDPHRSIRTPSIVQMTKVVNLRIARKRAARQQEEQRAAERRAEFGVPKAERLLVKARTDKARREVEGHRIGNGEGR